MKAPYYVWAPGWTPRSSGTRVLHRLVHELNQSGEKAYLCNALGGGYAVNPYLNTPVLNEHNVAYYASEGIDPIAVYPDVVKGNPFKLKKVVRYLLAPAGLYGGSSVEEFGEDDLIWVYRPDLLVGGGGWVLCLPTFDPEVFYPPEEGAERSGACFYAHKYDKIHGQKLLPITEGATRLEGKWEEIAEVLRKSKVCYVYEMSEIIVLAEMCSCPVEEVKTDYWGGLPEDWCFNLSMYGGNGRWATEDWQIRFKRQLAWFIERTQGWKEK